MVSVELLFAAGPTVKRTRVRGDGCDSHVASGAGRTVLERLWSRDLDQIDQKFEFFAYHDADAT